MQNIAFPKFCFNIDERIKSILINPRLNGLPHARKLSAILFLLIIVINIILAIVLADANRREVLVAVNVLNARDVNLECTGLEYTERVTFNFRSEFLGRQTKAFIAVEVRDSTKFNFLDHILSREQVETLSRFCSLESDLNTQYNFIPDSPEESFCLENINFARRLPPDQLPNSEIILRRARNDLFYEFSIPASNKKPGKEYQIFMTPLNSPEGYVINAVINTEVYSYDITLIPDFISFEDRRRDLNNIIFDFLFALGSETGSRDLIEVSLNPRFVDCIQVQGLSAFAYFALMFDYAFLLEGVFTVFVALALLRCLGYEIYNSSGTLVTDKQKEDLRNISESSNDNKVVEVKDKAIEVKKAIKIKEGLKTKESESESEGKADLSMTKLL